MPSKLFVESDWSSGSVTGPVAMNWKNTPAAVQITVTGTVNFDVESSNSDLQAGSAANWLVDSTETTGISASKWVTFNACPRFFRVKVNSGGTGATIRFDWVHNSV